jgi:Fur family peroxide stress response transcriptional regulator
MWTTEKIEELRTHCRENKIPLTQQRIEIYKALLDSEEHPSPEMVYRRLKMSFPTLSLATVYKNLEALARMGFAKKINPLSDHARYDGDVKQHSHFICLSCRKVEDISFDQLGSLEIPDIPDSDHIITAKTIVFMGICKACQENTPERRGA